MPVGDDQLSSHERKLWQIHQHILLTWGVYTVFKWSMYDCRDWTNGYLLWCVPLDVPERDEIVTWLEYELEDTKRKACEHTPGTDLRVTSSIEDFTGIAPYLERKHFRGMMRGMLMKMQRERGEGDEKGNSFLDALLKSFDKENDEEDDNARSSDTGDTPK